MPGFAIESRLGRGGMGVVYRATDRELKRTVAVKVLRSDQATGEQPAARFLEEAQITGQLQHPGIPAVYRAGTLADGRPFLAMKLIKGDALHDLVKGQKPVNTLAVFEAICHAVGYAHAHGVIHRDLKPANVMVGAFGEVQVMDWGLAKVLTNPVVSPPREQGTETDTAIQSPRLDPSRDTQHGSVLGTPAFMPPEQAAGQIDRLDARADVFSLGGILCVLLTGRPPYEGRTVHDVLLAAVRGETGPAFARLDQCNAEPAVVALCKQCLSFQPTDRPTDGAAVAAAVGRIRAEADERAKQAEIDRRAAQVQAIEERKRRRLLLMAAGLLLAVLTAGIVGTTAGLARANTARGEAEMAREDEASERKKAETKEAETAAVLKFVEERVFAAGRPEGQDGGLDRDVKCICLAPPGGHSGSVALGFWS